MNEPNENTEPTTVHGLHDRLMDRALAEVVDGDTPPDLSERILAAASAVQPVRLVPTQQNQRKRRLRWAGMAVAASLLVGATWLLLPAAPEFDRVSRSSAKLNQLDPTELFVVEDGRNERINTNAFDVRYDNKESLEALMRKNEKSFRPPANPSPEMLKELGMMQSDTTRSAPAKTAAVKEPASEAEPAFSTPRSQSVYESTTFEELSRRRSKYTNVDLAGKPDSGRVRAYAEVGDRFRFDNLAADNASGVAQPSTPLAAGYPARGEHESSREDVLRAINLPVAELGDGLGIRGGRVRVRAATDLGTGPGFSGDQYTRIHENPFIKAIGGDAVSTFSIDVDTASYANVRQFLVDMNRLPPPDAVRIEELVNYFRYDYAGPDAEEETPFAAHVEVAGCPWEPTHRLVRIGIQGREIERDQRPTSNLVFLVDVSGSMNQPSKLPLVVQGLEQLTRELGENDRVAIVVYASREGLVLESTPGSEQQTILAALSQLRAGGSTAGGAGIQLAYQIAEDHFITGGTNRVILCTDGDFNVGVTSTAELERLVEKKAKQTGVFLSVLGFGRGNLNDAMMETISGRGNGNYYYVDNRREARKVLVEEMSGTLVTIAKDVKIQVEFNPRQVAGYRLIGYENRMLRTEDFNDDAKDAGEIGAGHAVTALYEIVPAGKPVDVPPVDELRYQQSPGTAAESDAADVSGELLTLKMRFKQPDGDVSAKREWPVTDDGQAFSAATTDFQFAASVAGFGLLLRDSEHKGNATWEAVLEIAESSQGADPHGYRAEFVELVRRAKALREVR